MDDDNSNTGTGSSDRNETRKQEKFQTVGQGDHRVLDGECIVSIAAAEGHLWKTLWDLPANAQLKEARKNPNILYPGDLVTIPAIRLGKALRPTEETHKFRRKGTPCVLRIRLLVHGKALAKKPYRLDLDGASFLPGTTDDQGRLELHIPPGSRYGTLRVGEQPHERVYELSLGSLHPINCISGIKARLQNLGYAISRVDDDNTPDLTAAARKFQTSHDPDLTGKPEEETLKQLDCDANEEG